jgi:hypothetical protein
MFVGIELLNPAKIEQIMLIQGAMSELIMVLRLPTIVAAGVKGFSTVVKESFHGIRAV